MKIDEIIEAQRNPQETKQEARPRYVIRDAAYALQPQPPLEWVSISSLRLAAFLYGMVNQKQKNLFSSINGVCGASDKQWVRAYY